MVIWDAFRNGLIKVWENKILALILFIFKLFFAFSLLIPAYYMFNRTFYFSPSADNFLKGYDFSLLVDFFAYWSKSIGLYRVLFLFTILILAIGYIFLSGGLWGGLCQNLREGKQRFRGEKFFGDCGRFLWSFFRIFIFICILYVLVFILGMLIYSLIGSIAGKELSVTGHILILIIGLIIFAILFMWVDMLGDYMRIYRITFEEKKLRKILKPSLRFIFTNFDKTVLLYYLLSIILLGTLAIYFGLNKTLHLQPANGLMVLSVFIWQQAYSLFRSFYRLVYYSSQLILFDRISIMDSIEKEGNLGEIGV
ncbi:MAG TPA: hypothetical protein VMT04_05245 [Terriglobales bacterium]|nr:hypothetical protein [Terriglobales bacterium]